MGAFLGGLNRAALSSELPCLPQIFEKQLEPHARSASCFLCAITFIVLLHSILEETSSESETSGQNILVGELTGLSMEEEESRPDQSDPCRFAPMSATSLFACERVTERPRQKQ